MIKNNLKTIIIFIVFSLFAIQPGTVNAITPTVEQIAQFQKMSPEQQKLLAKQFGFDLDSIQGSLQKPTLEKAPPVVNPREIDYSVFEGIKPVTNEKDKQQLKPFGYDLFAGEPTSFSPVTEIPIPSEYVVGPGDELVIQLYGKQNDIFRLIVSRNGEIQFPELGPISIANLNFDDARKLLQKRIKNQIIGVESSISLGSLRSMRVFVLGDAYKPGSYEVSSLSTITNALFVSGGIKTIGSLRNIQLKRRGRLVTTLDLYDLLLKGDTSNDFRLLPGDVVFIPSVGARVSVDGEVIRPAIYEIKKNETLKHLLKMVGGLKPTANAKTALLNRINSRHVREALDIDLTNTVDTKIKLMNGDDLLVGEISSFVENTITLSGAVTRSGKYKWTDGIRVSDVIHNLNHDLLNDAELGYSIIVREVNQKHDIIIIEFSLEQMINNKQNSKLNPFLKESDELIVFSYKEPVLDEEENIEDRKVSSKEKFEQQLQEKIEAKELSEEVIDNSRLTLLKPIIEKLKRQSRPGKPTKLVYLNGEVKFPGQYPLSENATIKSIIQAGGGLTESAFSLTAEITRTRMSADEVVTVKHSPVDLSAVLQSITKDNLDLKSKDTVTIRIKPEWNETSRVEIKGEVKFPGTYVIERGETLSDLLLRAGGTTQLAYPNGAVFMREELREREQQLLDEMEERLKTELVAQSIGGESLGKGSQANSVKLLDEIQTTRALGRLVIDLPAILNDSSKYDLTLKDGDELVIPANAQTVTVIGQVQHATSHIFNQKLNVDEYIKISGGYTVQADDNRVYVIKANGSVMIPSGNNWFSAADSKLEAGDTIVVPLDTAYIQPLTLWSTVTQILYQTAIGIAAIGSI